MTTERCHTCLAASTRPSKAYSYSKSHCKRSLKIYILFIAPKSNQTFKDQFGVRFSPLVIIISNTERLHYRHSSKCILTYNDTNDE